MATWAGPYSCTDCGKPMDQAGTCTKCLVDNQPVPERLKEDLEKIQPRDRRRTDRGKR